MKILLKAPVWHYEGTVRPKFVAVRGRELHCFRSFRPLRFVIHRHVSFRMCSRSYNGYIVSELSTMLKVNGGFSPRSAIRNARENLKVVGISNVIRRVRRQKRALRRAGICV
jgi:hypothetical protein